MHPCPAGWEGVGGRGSGHAPSLHTELLKLHELRWSGHGGSKSLKVHTPHGGGVGVGVGGGGAVVLQRWQHGCPHVKLIVNSNTASLKQPLKNTRIFFLLAQASPKRQGSYPVGVAIPLRCAPGADACKAAGDACASEACCEGAAAPWVADSAPAGLRNQGLVDF